MLKNGEGCAKDLRQAAIWYGKGLCSYDVFDIEKDARIAFETENGKTEDLGCDFDQLCYALGWGLCWYIYGTQEWEWEKDGEEEFGNRCLDYYCDNVELQRKSMIFTFLLLLE
jgi:hypothetical protein